MRRLLWLSCLVLIPSESAADDEQKIYRYVGARGRPVYVNGKARVPPRHQGKARPVDLSHISLNKELAEEIEEQVERYEARAAKEREAREAREEKAGRPVLQIDQRDESEGAVGWLKRLWRNYDYLIVIAGALLLLLAFTPYMIKRMEPDRWVRILMIVLPLLCCLGILTYAMTRTAQMGAELRASVPSTSPGEKKKAEDGEFTTSEDGWVTRAKSKDPVPAAAPSTMRQLREMLDQLEARRQRALKEAR